MKVSLVLLGSTIDKCNGWLRSHVLSQPITL